MICNSFRSTTFKYVKFQRFKFAVRPSKEWGPENPEDRKQWVDMVMRRKVKRYRITQNDSCHQQFIELCVEVT